MVANGVLDLGIDVDVWPWGGSCWPCCSPSSSLTFLGGTFVLLPFAISAFVASLLAFYGVAVEVQGRLRAR